MKVISLFLHMVFQFRKAFLTVRIYPQILCQGENNHHLLLQALEAVRIIA